MATFGKTTVGAQSTTFGTVRAMSNHLPALSGMVLQSVSVAFEGAGAATRVAVWVGGALDDPSGAVLLEDLGVLTATGAGFNAKLSATNPALPSGALVWVSLTGNGFGWSVFYDDSSAAAGDWQTARGRYNSAALSGANTDPYPSTWPADSGSFGSFWISAYLTYSTAGGGSNTAPTVTITSPADSITLPVGAQYPFTATATDAESGSLAVAWSTSDAAVATVSSGGVVTAVSDGFAEIQATATDPGGLSDSDNRTVQVGAESGDPVIIYIPEDGADMEIITWGTATTLRVPLRTAAGAVVTSNVLGSGDVTLSKDGATAGNTAANGTIASWAVVNGHVEVPISATEAQCAEGTLLLRDVSGGGAFMDRTLKFRTENHPAAFYPNGAQGAGAVPSGGGVASGALSVGVTRSHGEFLPGAVVGFSGGASARIATVTGTTPNLTLGFATGAGLTKAVAAGETAVAYVDALPDKTGVVLAPVTHTGAVIPTVSTAGSITNPVTVGTNNDKSNYGLAASQSGVTIGTVTSVTNPVAATLNTTERNGLITAFLARELVPGLTYEDVLLGRFDVEFIETSPGSNTGTFRYTPRSNTTPFTQGTYNENARGRVMKMDSA